MNLLSYSLVIFCSLLPLFCLSQTQEKLQHINRVEGGTSVGGSGSVYFFTYNSGSHFRVAHGVRVTERANVLLAAGLEKYQTGVLFPLTLQADRIFGKRRKSLFKIHGGYTFSFSNRVNTNFQQKGGLATGMDYGWYLFRKPKLALYATLGYHFRRTVLVHRPFANNPEIRNRTDNHLLVLNAGLEF